MVRFTEDPVVQEKMRYYLSESAAMGQPLGRYFSEIQLSNFLRDIFVVGFQG